MTDDNTVIRMEGVRMHRGRVLAVDDLSLTVPRGSVFGLIGPNGAGKTTTIKILLGLLRPQGGTSSVYGEDSLRLSPACRQRIGYLSEEPFPYDELPIHDLLRFVSGYFDAWDWDRTRELLDHFDVPRNRMLKDMSVGERRKAELLVVLAQQPDLLILDDPAIGLDATVRREFLWAALELAREEGKTVLFTSHILQDVERVVDTIGILVEGRLHTHAALDDLKAATKRLVLELGDDHAAESIEVPGEISRSLRDRRLEVTTSTFDASLVEALRPRVERVHVEDVNLEEIFCAVVEGAEGAVSGVGR